MNLQPWTVFIDYPVIIGSTWRRLMELYQIKVYDIFSNTHKF